MNPTRKDVNTLFRTDFYSFMQRAVQEVDPGIKLVPSPYLEALCFELMQVQRGGITRLIVNMPPRHLKSVVTSVMWVASILMEDPRKKIAIICHDDTLALQLATKCKSLLNSDWYRALAPNVRIEGLDRAKDFATSRGGRVYAASIESGITGHGFDVIILDDPQPAKNAGSEAERKRVQTLFDSGIGTRLNDPVHGAFVVVQQRLHEDDLSGYLLTRGSWKHLCFPLVCFEETTYALGARTWTRPIDDVLLPSLYPIASIERLQAEKGPQNYWTQYQQAPSSVRGEVIKSEYLKTITMLPPSAQTIFVSVDTAAKNLPTSDYTVFLVVATDHHRHYIIDVIRKRLDVGEMRDVALRLSKRHKIHRFLIEDSASGPSLSTLLRENGLQSELINVATKSKEERLREHIHLFIDGRVFLVGDAPWIAPLRFEAENFPVGKYDDQIDAMSLYFAHVEKGGGRKPCLLGANSSQDRAFPSYRPPAKGDNPLRPRGGRGTPRRY